MPNIHPDELPHDYAWCRLNMQLFSAFDQTERREENKTNERVSIDSVSANRYLPLNKPMFLNYFIMEPIFR